MEFEPTVYNSVNCFQITEAQAMIDRIRNDNPGKTMEVIVDIGCGTGNVTRMLGKSIPHKQILAFDVDSKMVDFANNNSDNDEGCSVEFVIEDVAKPWNGMDPKIQALEGTVDLIFSNYALHWLTETSSASQNMFRLLKPGGLIYLNVGIVKTICDFLLIEEKEEIEKYLKVQPPANQMADWSSSLQTVGFQNVDLKLVNNEWKFDSANAFMEILALFLNRYLKDIPEDCGLESEMKTKIEDVVYKTLSVKTGQAPPEKFIKDECHLFYDAFRIRADKPVKLGSGSWCHIL